MQGSKGNTSEIAKSLYLGLTLLQECNLKCGYCHPYGENRVSSGPVMKLADAVELIDCAVEIGFEVFRLTGGEPTLLPWFGELLDQLLTKYKHIKVNISTNGAKLSQHLALIEQHRDRIQIRVSIDTLDSNLISQGYDKILTDPLSKLLKELFSRKIPTRLNIVGTQLTKPQIPQIIKLALKYHFDVKILDIYYNDKFIATDGVNGNKRELLGISSDGYWKENFLRLDDIEPQLEVLLGVSPKLYNKDGGFGVPMHAYEINDSSIIMKNSTNGSHFHPVICIQKCSTFKTTCQEGLYAPHVSSNLVLHASGCHNPNLQWDLKNKSQKEKIEAFNAMLSLMANLQLVNNPPWLNRIEQE